MKDFERFNHLYLNYKRWMPTRIAYRMAIRAMQRGDKS